MIPNSIAGPAEGVMAGESLELYKRGTRNVLWLTVREGRRFILKGLPEELRLHPEETMRLRKEYSLGLRINHPGVVGVYGFEVHPSAESLQKKLEKAGSNLSAAQAARLSKIAAKMANAMM